MKLNGSIVIDERKIKEYLLVWKPQNDKSKFLNKIGYYESNWENLRTDIVKIVAENEAELSRIAPNGDGLYKVVGRLKDNFVVTIWLLNVENEIKFVTLYPF